MKQARGHKPAIDFDADATDHPIVTVRVRSSKGMIAIMGEIVRRGNGLELAKVHLHSDVGANAFGAAELRRLVRMLMEMFDVDSVMVTGTRRIGRGIPGNRTRSLRCTRQAAP
jgi:hypothetical protein